MDARSAAGGSQDERAFDCSGPSGGLPGARARLDRHHVKLSEACSRGPPELDADGAPRARRDREPACAEPAIAPDQRQPPAAAGNAERPAAHAHPRHARSSRPDERADRYRLRTRRSRRRRGRGRLGPHRCGGRRLVAERVGRRHLDPIEAGLGVGMADARPARHVAVAEVKAIKAGRRLAEQENGELVIHGEGGQVARRTRTGTTPATSPGDPAALAAAIADAGTDVMPRPERSPRPPSPPKTFRSTAAAANLLFLALELVRGSAAGLEPHAATGTGS
jgi:Uncharacterized protein conserved in bacteria (DUF2188)